MMFISVLLPEPEAPTMATNCPRGTSTETPPSASTETSPESYCLRISRSERTALSGVASGAAPSIRTSSADAPWSWWRGEPSRRSRR